MRGREPSNLAKNEDTQDKINQKSKGYEEEKNFNCLNCKARSLFSKQELKWLIYEHEFFLVGITETRLGNLHDWNTEIIGCNLFRKEVGRKSAKRHFMSKMALTKC